MGIPGGPTDIKPSADQSIQPTQASLTTNSENPNEKTKLNPTAAQQVYENKQDVLYVRGGKDQPFSELDKDEKERVRSRGITFSENDRFMDCAKFLEYVVRYSVKDTKESTQNRLLRGGVLNSDGSDRTTQQQKDGLQNVGVKFDVTIGTTNLRQSLNNMQSKNGVVIYIDSGKGANNWDANRADGIDHVIYVENGFVYESTGRKDANGQTGVTKTPLDEWLSDPSRKNWTFHTGDLKQAVDSMENGTTYNYNTRYVGVTSGTYTIKEGPWAGTYVVEYQNYRPDYDGKTGDGKQTPQDDPNTISFSITRREETGQIWVNRGTTESDKNFFIQPFLWNAAAFKDMPNFKYNPATQTYTYGQGEETTTLTQEDVNEMIEDTPNDLIEALNKAKLDGNYVAPQTDSDSVKPKPSPAPTPIITQSI